ncbi:MAG TPA: DUF952 domain-containing protein [Caulobacteraceae bacterium]
MSRIYKILSGTAWRAALEKGRFEGAGVDLTDGFIHFSTAGQASETARRYFSHQPDLVVLEVESEQLSPNLKWEPSRGGELFPHLYAALPCALVVEVHAVALGDDGAPSLPADLK